MRDPDGRIIEVGQATGMIEFAGISDWRPARAALIADEEPLEPIWAFG